jgi:hypothetical protein
VERGFRWIKNPAAISPVWLEKPPRIAALAMLTVVGLLAYGLIQRQVRQYLAQHKEDGDFEQMVVGEFGDITIGTRDRVGCIRRSHGLEKLMYVPIRRF